MTNSIRMVLLSLFLAALGGCAVVPMAPYDDHPVRLAPPPPRAEYPGRAPYDGYVWLNGYWYWGGREYVWIGGSWAAPRPGYRWTPHRWERQGDRWEMRGGRWENEGHGHYEAPRIAPRREPLPVYSPPRQVPVVPPRYEDHRRNEPEIRGQSPYGQERRMGRESPMPSVDPGGRAAMPRPETRPAVAPPMPPQPAMTPPPEMRRQDRGEASGGRPQRDRDETRQQGERDYPGGRSRHFRD